MQTTPVRSGKNGGLPYPLSRLSADWKVRPRSPGGACARDQDAITTPGGENETRSRVGTYRGRRRHRGGPLSALARRGAVMTCILLAPPCASTRDKQTVGLARRTVGS